MKSQSIAFRWIAVAAVGCMLLVVVDGQAQTNRTNPNLYRSNVAKPAPKNLSVRGPTAGNVAKMSSASSNYYVDPAYYQYAPNPYSPYPNQYGTFPGPVYSNPYLNGFPGMYMPNNFGYVPYNLNPYGMTPYGYFRGY